MFSVPEKLTSFKFIVAFIGLVALAGMHGITANIPDDATKKSSYQIAASVFGMLGYGIYVYLMYLAYTE